MEPTGLERQKAKANTALHMAACHRRFTLQPTAYPHEAILTPNTENDRVLRAFGIEVPSRVIVNPIIVESMRSTLKTYLALHWPNGVDEETAPMYFSMATVWPTQLGYMTLSEAWQRDWTVIAEMWADYVPIQPGEDYSDPEVWEAFRQRVGLSA